MHGTGTENHTAYAFSRLRTTWEDEKLLDEDLPVLFIEKQENGEQSIHELNTYHDEDILH